MKLTLILFFQAADRVQTNLRKINSPIFVQNFGKMSEISKNICSSQGVVQTNPLGV